MPSVTRRPAARQDLAEIWDFIAQDDPKRATKFLRELEATFVTLAEIPLMGRTRLELGEDVRSLAQSNYIIYYIPWADGIDILRVLHGSRDITRLS